MDGLASTGTCITCCRKTKAIKRELSVFHSKAFPNTKYLQYKYKYKYINPNTGNILAKKTTLKNIWHWQVENIWLIGLAAVVWLPGSLSTAVARCSGSFLFLYFCLFVNFSSLLQIISFFLGLLFFVWFGLSTVTLCIRMDPSSDYVLRALQVARYMIYEGLEAESESVSLLNLLTCKQTGCPNGPLYNTDNIISPFNSVFSHQMYIKEQINTLPAHSFPFSPSHLLSSQTYSYLAFSHLLSRLILANGLIGSSIAAQYSPVNDWLATFEDSFENTQWRKDIQVQ